MAGAPPTGLQMEGGRQSALSDLGDHDDGSGARLGCPLQSHGLSAEARRVENHDERNDISAGELLGGPEHSGRTWTDEQEIVEADPRETGGMENASTVDYRDSAAGGGEAGKGGQHRNESAGAHRTLDKGDAGIGPSSGDRFQRGYSGG